MAIWSSFSRSNPQALLSNRIAISQNSSRSSRRHSRSRSRLLVLLRSIWTLSLFWAELLSFYRSISSCTWPIPTNNDLGPHDLHPFKLLLIADPQLPSTGYSYPSRSYPLRLLSVKIIDQFIRKAWRLVLALTKPDAVLFLGDLLDGGIATQDPLQFAQYVHRFSRTFPIPASLRPSDHKPPALIFMAGNHDLGLAPDTSPAASLTARKRFMRTWPPGKLNGLIEWGNHTIIWLDAIGLIEEHKRRATGQLPEGAGPATEFVHGLTGPAMLLPKILFSHVPLWRPDGTSCGPLREHQREIRQGAGKNYQNELPESLSRMLLERIQPVLVFSGDDHDHCEVVHTVPSGSLANPAPLEIPEISLKSFSMGMGVARPGYGLVTLANPARFARAPEERTAFPRTCVLPSQIQLYTHLYLPLLAITIGLLFGPPVTRLIRRSRAAPRLQAKTNGLPIRQNRHKHRKSLSRTLMFQRALSGSSSSSESSADERRSDEEAASFAPQNARRSLSLALDGADGYGSPTGALSYHSPVDSAHDDDRLSYPSPALDSTYSSRSPGIAESDYPPTYRPSRLQPRGSRSDGLLMAIVSVVAGKRTSERVKRWLVRRGLWRRTSGLTGIRSNPGVLAEFEDALSNFVQLVGWILGIWFLIWLWFWW